MSLLRALVLALLIAPAAAQEPSFEARINEAFRALTPAPRAAPSVGTWTEEQPRWLNGSTFLGPLGVKLDRSCMAFEGAAYPSTPAKFVAGLRKMHATLQKCAAERVVPATVGLIYRYAPRVTIYCDPAACVFDKSDAKVLACASLETQKITFKEKSAYPAADTLLHELAHITGHVDNQTTDEHLNHGSHPLRDEIYFWERHCFDQTDLLRRMREALVLRLDAAGLDRHSDDSLVLKKIYAETYEVCARPFRYNVRRKLRANEREVAAVCKQYSDFLMMEINLERFTRRMTAEAGVCSKVSDKAECPSAEFFREGTPLAKALEEAGLIPPPQGPYSADAFAAWTEKACTFYDSRTAAGNPSGDLFVCAKRLEERVADPERLLTLFGAGVDWAQITLLQDYFRRLAAKARALHSGPGGYDHSVPDDAADETLRKAYASSLAECAKPLIKDTRFCADLSLDESPMRLLGALRLHWRPRTLPQ